jgi:hypothetical protein
MKKLLLGCVILACTSLCFAQTAAVPFKFSTQAVLIPTPEGMVDEFGKNAEMTTNIAKQLEPAFQLLAVYETKEDVIRREKGGSGPPGFYTSVGSIKSLKDFDVAPDDFAVLVAKQIEPFPLELDPKNKELILTLNKAEKGLVGNPPVVFGWFDKQPDSFSAMMLVGWKLVGVPVTAGLVISYVHVKKRVVYLRTFRIVNDMNDVVTLADFVKKWSAEIKAANK